MVLAANSADSEGVREKIVAAARDELARFGYAGASVRRIAERAGVTAAMINYYFGGKQALNDTVVADAQGRLLARLATAIEAGDRTGLPERLAVAYFDFLADERQLQRLLVREMLDRGDELRPRAGEVVGPLREILERHFGDRPGAHQLAISVFGAIAGYFLYEPVLGAILGSDPMSPENLAARRCHVAELASLIERSTP